MGDLNASIAWEYVLMRRMKSKWFAILAAVFALAGAATVMTGCDDPNDSSQEA